MKAKREASEFKPVTITLETQEELDILSCLFLYTSHSEVNSCLQNIPNYGTFDSRTSVTVKGMNDMFLEIRRTR